MNNFIIIDDTLKSCDYDSFRNIVLFIYLYIDWHRMKLVYKRANSFLEKWLILTWKLRYPYSVSCSKCYILTQLCKANALTNTPLMMMFLVLKTSFSIEKSLEINAMCKMQYLYAKLLGHLQGTCF